MPSEVQVSGTVSINSIWKHFQSRENNELTAQATLLDPRFQKQGFSDAQKFKDAVGGLLGKV
jgi:hypothetical protein